MGSPRCGLPGFLLTCTIACFSHLRLKGPCADVINVAPVCSCNTHGTSGKGFLQAAHRRSACTQLLAASPRWLPSCCPALSPCSLVSARVRLRWQRLGCVHSSEEQPGSGHRAKVGCLAPVPRLLGPVPLLCWFSVLPGVTGHPRACRILAVFAGRRVGPA